MTVETVSGSRRPGKAKARGTSTADALLFTMGGAMFLVTALAAVLIVEPSMGLMLATFATLVVLVGVVGMFLIRFIDAEH